MQTMMRMMAAGAFAIGMAGCTTTGDGGAAVPSGDAIAYETGPCFGQCPVFGVTVKPDGTGTFEGKRFTAAEGQRTFTATPAQYQAFAQALAPYRPGRGDVRYEPGSRLCPNHATDQTSVTVRWMQPDGAGRSLYYYFGCGMQDRSMGNALKAAVEQLPIAELVGER